MIEFKVDDHLSKKLRLESCLLLEDIFRYSCSDKLIDLMKSPEQKKAEQKMIDMFIHELNKKGNENNES